MDIFDKLEFDTIMQGLSQLNEASLHQVKNAEEEVKNALSTYNIAFTS